MQGASEILLDDSIEEKIKEFTGRVINAEYKVPVLSDKCPVCFGSSFNLVDNITVKYPVCNITGKITECSDNKTLLLFSESGINNSRWSKENLRDHMENWVAGSGQKYKEKVKEILKRRKSLLDK